MGDFVGGCIFFRPEQTGENIVTATLKSMELPSGAFEVLLPGEDGFPRFSSDGYPLRHPETLEQGLTVLAQLEGGVIEASGIDHHETFWFEPKVGSYPIQIIWVPDSSMFYNRQPEYIEHFVQSWAQLCEQGNAVFGFFSPFDHTFEREKLEQKIVPALQKGEVAPLFGEAEVYWLIYLGPELAKKWREQQMPLPPLVKPILSEELPSGAHFLRRTRSVYDL